jgi:uroporphyrinogen decarboxylase
MTPRERVRAVLNHQIPDRIPNGLGGCETAGLHVIAYEKLQNLLGVEKKLPRIDCFESNAVFELDVIKAMEGDIVLIASPKLCKSDLRGPGVEAQWKEQELWGRCFLVSVEDEYVTQPDGSVIWKEGWRGGGPVIARPGSFFFDDLPGDLDLDETECPRPEDVNPSRDWPDAELRRLEETARFMYNETDLSLSIGEVSLDLSYLPGGWIKGWMFIAEYPERMKEILDKFADAALARLRLLDQAVGSYVDIVNMAHDMGHNLGLFVGPEKFREIYKPNYEKLFQGWKKITGMKCCLHSCGAIAEVMGDLAECGLEIYNPVQISGANMNPEDIKEQFGGLVFWGGAYDHHLCSPEESYESIYEKTSRNIKALAKNGGYIMSGVHNLLPEIPVHHLKAVLDAWKDNRNYERISNLNNLNID